jgi:sugar (pentulose or hexulose) kinase
VADFFLGLDFGTSGARACVLGESDEPIFESHREYVDPADPQQWREALLLLISSLPEDIRVNLNAIAIDGTSGTVLATDAEFEPLSPALLYNDDRASVEARFIGNPQFGPSSGLAKRLWLATHYSHAAHCLHQADWLAALLTGKSGSTDYHNALKSGFDVENLEWPAWVGKLPGAAWQQQVLAPGETMGTINATVAHRLGLNAACNVRAGTTDSIAAFIASGASCPGDAVTSLGTTLVLKLLSTTRVDDPASGVYSHRYGQLWLAGGASNSGGGVLKQFFTNDELEQLSSDIDTDQPCGLDYYPLPKPGERFPINDPELMPRMEPRPTSDVAFLHGLLNSMAKIEALGYAKLAALGASPLRQVFSAGGGATNQAWRRIRERLLGVPVSAARQGEAAYGAALLARSGNTLFPTQIASWRCSS